MVKAPRVTVLTREDRKVLRLASHIIGEAAGDLYRSHTMPPARAGDPRIWPTSTHEDLRAKRDYEDSMVTAKALLRLANRRPK